LGNELGKAIYRVNQIAQRTCLDCLEQLKLENSFYTKKPSQKQLINGRFRKKNGKSKGIIFTKTIPFTI